MTVAGKARLISMLVGGAFVMSWMVYSMLSKSQRSNANGAGEGSDRLSTAIVILGGGLLPDGSVPPHTLLRIEKAVQVFHELNGQAVIIPLSGGTPHKPNPLDREGFPVWESTAAAKKLIELGIPVENVLEENFSLDTIGNAYFLRMVHVVPARYSKLVVITNTWHMPRTQAIFDAVFLLPLHRDDLHLPSAYPRIEYLTVPAGIRDETVLAARTEREQASTRTFEEKTRWLWKSMDDLHRWLYSEHAAYASKRLVPKPPTDPTHRTQINSLALSTY